MATTMKSEMEWIAESAKEITDKLDSLPREEAEAYATELLIAIGALDENGKPKEQIVNGDFFGWP